MGLREEMRKEATEMWGVMLGMFLIMAYMAWDVVKVLGIGLIIIFLLASLTQGMEPWACFITLVTLGLAWFYRKYLWYLWETTADYLRIIAWNIIKVFMGIFIISLVLETVGLLIGW